MKIVADMDIPHFEACMQGLGPLVLKPGRLLDAADLKDADALFVRSVTHVDASLLSKSPIRFVGSFTTGLDHLDLAYLAEKKIECVATVGFNAQPVVEYILSLVASLKKNDLLPDRKLRAAVIGVGKIGAQVSDLLTLLGFEVLHCDPIRAALESDFEHTDLNDLRDLDFLTLHIPLTHEGLHPTCHLIGKEFLCAQRKNCVLVNTSRGAVINFDDLKHYGHHLYWCLDVWDNEPIIDLEILPYTAIATPHIAGYSVQSRVRAMQMMISHPSFKALFGDTFFDVSAPVKSLDFNHQKIDWMDVVLENFNPEHLSLALKNIIKDVSHSAQIFDQLRKNTLSRYECAATEVLNADLDPESRFILQQLGFNLS